jgi:hypothetical protein|tara:strand:- start:149 stop:379 length:231 start_codon:yes stop_codon:yes gene_type:complete
MQPTLDPKELQGLSDIWKNITDPTNNPPEETEVEPVPYEVSSGAISKREELQATGKFTSDEIDNILATVEEPAEEE